MLAEVEGMELGRSLEVPIALAEVEGTEPGGAPVAVVMFGGECCFPLASCDVVEWS